MAKATFKHAAVSTPPAELPSIEVAKDAELPRRAPLVLEDDGLPRRPPLVFEDDGLLYRRRGRTMESGEDRGPFRGSIPHALDTYEWNKS